MGTQPKCGRRPVSLDLVSGWGRAGAGWPRWHRPPQGTHWSPPTAQGLISWGWWETSLPHQGQGRARSWSWRVVSSQYGKEGGRKHKVGRGLWPETWHQPGVGQGRRGGLAPPAGLHGAEGPVGGAGGGGGPCCWWWLGEVVSDVGEGLRGVWALRVLCRSQTRGSVRCPLGGGTVPAPKRLSVRLQWEVLAQASPSESWKCLQVGGAWSGGRWAGVLGGAISCCPACPSRP